MRGVLLFVALSGLGCGAKVVVGTGGEDTGGTGGAGGAGAGQECVLPCGAECTKCVGDSCYTGWCSDTGTCMTPDLPATCSGE